MHTHIFSRSDDSIPSHFIRSTLLLLSSKPIDGIMFDKAFNFYLNRCTIVIFFCSSFARWNRIKWISAYKIACSSLRSSVFFCKTTSNISQSMRQTTPTIFPPSARHSLQLLSFSRILKILLRELIEKSLQQDRSNSKILLRSNASVAEKMLSNWFAFLLFGYIKVRRMIDLFPSHVARRMQKGTSRLALVHTLSID